MSLARFDVLVVGGGHGGATVAAGLRQHGYKGSIALLTEEAHIPYERPPLSKEYLAGERPLDRMWIRPPEFWESKNIEVLTGHRVCDIQVGSNSIGTSHGAYYGYGDLVWAAGGMARRLRCEGSDLKGIRTLRSLDDAEALKLEIGQAQSVVIVGGGYIGLEAAAILRKWGKTVTLVESMSRVLARVAAEPLSSYVQSYHRAQGVDFMLNDNVVGFLGERGRVSHVNLGSGASLRADLVIVGIGIVPCVEPLQTAGASGDNGVLVDECCKTSLPSIYAVGDCALHSNDYAQGKHVRIESVQNAHDQAQAVSRTLSGNRSSYKAVPWFWSNQYDLKLQTIGLSAGHDEVTVRGDPVSKSFSVIYLRKGKVVALDCVNSPKDFVHGRALVSRAVIAPVALLTDMDISLKDIAAAS